MDLQQIISQLTEKFGSNFDVSKVTNVLKGLDLKNLNFNDIVAKLHADGLLAKVGDLNLDNVKDSLGSLKDKAGDMLGGLFGK